MIYTFIPYAPSAHDKDLGFAYNSFMELLPKDDDWACFLDHDAMFTTLSWYKQFEDIVMLKPDAGCFTAMTNRIGNPIQVHGYEWELLRNSENRVKRHFEVLALNHSNHDMMKHRLIGKKLLDEKYSDLQELGMDNPMSGVLMLVKKATWNRIRFKSGFLGVDRTFHKDCVDNGLKVFLMTGVYVYHWYRGDGDLSHVEEFF